MTSENPAGCIYPKCKCSHRCKDLFEPDSVIELDGGTCPVCKKWTSVYKFEKDFVCKNCIAEMVNSVK